MVEVDIKHWDLNELVEGDKVMMAEDGGQNAGKRGTVSRVNGRRNYRIRFDDGSRGQEYVKASQLQDGKDGLL